ncbi:1-acyl-sn-glycerol-3-phosphate acyltransferase [candidate division WOR-3 bacterium]|uniref:1-acyl-sn-glycerol-3-phosphate acyltransferase n=1 Tax=candidate division WOR-3 bacterium TaxID=2052148 RepID=A0A660SIT1_UNCW3|nr:MAG: 1-acyl-sn-glycerol-3-phosphate acyltransferase [candidate division WOR-3 bacterium]
MTSRWLLAHLIATPLARLLFGLKITGIDNIPRGPVIFAANHLSFLDPPVLGYAVHREVHFVAKEELFRIRRFFTWLIRYFNAISIKRDGDITALKRILKILKEKGSVVIFPEGTRSKTGDLLPFLPGIGLIALKSRVPVVPIYIRNSNAPLLEIFLRKRRLEVRFGPPLYPNGFPATKEGYHRFTETLYHKVRELKDANRHR